MWLAMSVAILLVTITAGLSRKRPIQESIESSFEVAAATHASPFIKPKHAVELDSKHEHQDEIDAIDFSLLNDRSRWVDPAWLP